MDEALLHIWKVHNDDGFDGVLVPPSHIDWKPLSGADGIGAHGTFVWRSGGILIDERFRFDKTLAQEEGSKDHAKLLAAVSLVLHEMIHQALYQFDDKDFGKHTGSFIRIASDVAGKMGLDPPTDKASAEVWPDIRGLIYVIEADDESTPMDFESDVEQSED